MEYRVVLRADERYHLQFYSKGNGKWCDSATESFTNKKKALKVRNKLNGRYL